MNLELERILNHCQEHGISSILIGLTDMDGVIRGKYVDLQKFKDLVGSTGGMCDCIFGWDIDDHLYDFGSIGERIDSPFTGWNTGFADLRYRLVSSTERYVPGTKMPYFVGELVSNESEYHPLCPRSLLRRIVDSLSRRNVHVVAGYEYEFFVIDESAQVLRDQDYYSLRSITKGRFGYSVLRAAANSSQLTDFMDYCREFDTSLEGLHFEADPGTWEAALNKRVLLESADCASLFKTFAKTYFQQHGSVASFMAKWSMNFPGQSGHFHFSLVDENGEDLFRTRDGELNDIGKFAIGGLTKFLPEWLPMLAPNVNSFTRLTKGAWAPIGASWGEDNRTCAFRVIRGGDNGFHIENRVPGADSNPYLVGAATLAAVKLGIEREIEPPPCVTGNAYDVANSENYARFPSTLRESARRMSECDSAHEAFGKEFVEHYVASRIWESREAERSVNDWQVRRYFEAS